MEPWIIITSISLAFSIPVLLSSYYTVILFVSSLRYPRILSNVDPPRENLPLVSILIAAYNEKFVIGRTLDAIKNLDYPAGKLQVIVADDSTDDTRNVLDEKVKELNSSGIVALVSRRNNREGFKSGALNHAAPLLRGEYVLLLDADSTVTPASLSRGLAAFRLDPRIAFVSFRVGHYNREQNLITRLFALSQDQGDTITKMGSYTLDAPYSFQGGFTLMSLAILREVGFWTNDSIVDDADLSCKIYSAGWRGVYLSYVQKIMTAKNLLLLPLISYTTSCMTTAICIGFLQGIRGRPGFFFRTPKSGFESSERSRQYFRDVQHDRIAIAEAVLAILAIGIGVIVLTEGVWVLFLSLAGFGVLTLKSMNLSRIVGARSQQKGQ